MLFRLLIILSINIITIPSIAKAGGDYFQGRVKSISWSGDSHFSIALELHTVPVPLGEEFKGKTIVIDLEYDPPGSFWSNPKNGATEQEFIKGMNILFRELEHGEVIRLGLMIGGIEDIPGKELTFRSTSLLVIDGNTVAFN